MKTRILTAAVVAALASAPAFATNGYFSHGYGAKSKGMAGAGSVYSQEALVGATNPASIALVGNRADLGVELFKPDRSADVNYGAITGTYDGNGYDMFLVPDFGYVQRLNDVVTAGLLVYGNGGMNTKYDCGIYSSMGAGCTGPVTGVDMAQLFISPTISWDINDNNNIGAKLNIAYQRFKAYGLSDFAAYTHSGSTNNLTNLSYDYSAGLGLGLGWTGKVSNSLTLGAAFNTRTYMEKYEKYKELFAEQGDFDIPANINLGMAFKASPQATIAFDVQHIFYGDVKSISNPNNDAMCAGAGDTTCLGDDAGKGFGWDDMTIYKLGFEYQASEKLALRAGISHGGQPIGANDTDFNLIAPAVIEDHASLGFTYTLQSGDSVTGYYTHAFENSVNGSGTAGGDNANKLTMSQDALGIAYSWKMD